MKRYCIGMDFGTNSCRALVVDLDNGRELAGSVFAYPSGDDGVVLDAQNPNLARQNPADYHTGILFTIPDAMRRAKETDDGFSPSAVIGIGICTTGSSPMPIDQEGMPLCFLPQFEGNPDAMVWLWKDHTAFAEAEEITKLARAMHPEYLTTIGGTYSSEWFWSKILRCSRVAPEVFWSTHRFVEICDYLPALLCGTTVAGKMRHSVCAAGHKALFNPEWGGLPEAGFMESLSPDLVNLSQRLYKTAFTAEHPAGKLSATWAQKLGLPEGVSVAVGAFDAHLGAIGAGIEPKALVKIIGTSTCDILIAPKEGKQPIIPGICGIVDGSVREGFWGIEAGQSAVGDLFLWLLNNLAPSRYGTGPEEQFRQLGQAAAELAPGECGLLALDWNNGNRTILVDARLSGLLLGQTLHTEAHEIYRALIEATGFGARTIIEQLTAHGQVIDRVVCCGGLAEKNELLMQCYADICDRPMLVSRSAQTPALGAAIMASVCAGAEAGGYRTVQQACQKMTGSAKTYLPDPQNRQVYDRLYGMYKTLHDSFGRDPTASGQSLYALMKDLLNLRDQVREKKNGK